MFWFVELKLNSPGTFTGKNIASHADVLRGSSRVPAPRTSTDLSEKKKTKTNHSRLLDLGSALWTLRNFVLDFIAPEKVRRVS